MTPVMVGTEGGDLFTVTASEDKNVVVALNGDPIVLSPSDAVWLAEALLRAANTCTGVLR